MRILVKVYEHMFVRNIITQEFIDSQLTIEDDIRDFSIAQFEMPLVSIEEDNYIEIYESFNADVLIFSGFVYKITPKWKQFGILGVECRGEKAIMNKRYALKTKSSFNVKSISSLPTYPASVEYGVNYWVNSSMTGLYNLLGVITPEAPESGPTPDPYYDWGFIPFTDTTFVIDVDTNQVKRLENGSILNEGTGDGVDINWILSDLIDDYSSNYNEDWTYITDFNQNISLNIKKGDNYFDVFDELAEQTGSYWTIENKVIKFIKNGVDKSTGESMQEIIYNGLTPNTSNVSRINVVGTATRCNIVLGQDQNGNVMINNSGYVDRIYGVGKSDFRDGNLYEKTNKYLEDINRSQRIYQVEVESNTILADVGDKIKLTIENTNKYFDISSNVMVLSKVTTYTNGSKIVNYAVGELNLKVATSENWLYGIKKDIKLLKVG